MENNLYKLIRLYAYLISTDTDLGFRIKIHDMICLWLDIPKKDFCPFDSEDIWQTPNFEEAIIIIQKDINRLKRKYNFETDYKFNTG